MAGRFNSVTFRWGHWYEVKDCLLGEGEVKAGGRMVPEESEKPEGLPQPHVGARCCSVAPGGRGQRGAEPWCSAKCLMEAYGGVAAWGGSPLKHNVVVCFFLLFSPPRLSRGR